MLPDRFLRWEILSNYTNNPCLALVENYVSVGADIDENDKTYHFIKVGKATEAISRCDKQRLKLIWAIAPKRNAEKFCYPREGYESKFMTTAFNLFGHSKPDYNMAGRTESYGRFETAQDAMEGCWKIFEVFISKEAQEEKKLNIDITGNFIVMNKKWIEKASSIIDEVTKIQKLVA